MPCSIFCGCENSWYTSTRMIRSIWPGGSLGSVSLPSTVSTLVSPAFAALSRSSSSISGCRSLAYTLPPGPDALGHAQRYVAGSGADFGHGHARLQADGVERAFDVFLGFALRALQPVRAADAHHVGDVAAGERDASPGKRGASTAASQPEQRRAPTAPPICLPLRFPLDCGLIMLKRPSLPSLCLLTLALVAGLPLAGCKKQTSGADQFSDGRARDRHAHDLQRGANRVAHAARRPLQGAGSGAPLSVDHALRHQRRRTAGVGSFLHAGGSEPGGISRNCENGDGVDNWFGLLREIAPAETKQGNIVFDVPLGLLSPASYRWGRAGIGEICMGRNSTAHRHGFTGRHAAAWAQVDALGPLAAVLGAIFLGAALPASAAFSVDRIALHQFEDGPVLGPNHAFLPGETVFFSCRLTGYQLAVTGDDQRSVKLSWTIAGDRSSGTFRWWPKPAAKSPSRSLRRTRTGIPSFCIISISRRSLPAARITLKSRRGMKSRRPS